VWPVDVSCAVYAHACICVHACLCVVHEYLQVTKNQEHVASYGVMHGCLPKC
jgi:hypothetical protein